MGLGIFDVRDQRPLYGIAADMSALLKRSIRKLMIDVLEDDILHAECVAAGEFKFREVFVRDLGAVFGKNRGDCDHLANVVYRFFRESWKDRHPEITPTAFLDHVSPIAPPTESEIEAAWQLDIASSDGAMSQMYEGTARQRKGRLEEMGLKFKMEKPS